MASLRRKPRSPYWFACFIKPDGNRTQRSTKETDRKKALALANQWEDAARKRITEAQARRVLSDIHEQIHGSPLATPSVEDYVEQWLARKQVETASVTHAAYKGAVREFAAFLGDKAAQPLHYVTPAQISKWRDRSAVKATARTANNKLKVVRVLFQTAWRDGLLTDNPAAKVPTLKTAKSKRRAFSLPELRSVLKVASQEWQGMVLFGLYTGQRLKDIASLQWTNVDLEQNEIRFSTSKTSRFQVIPLASALQRFVEGLPSSDDPRAPLFPNAHKIATTHLHTGLLSRQFSELLATAGLVKAQPNSHEGSGKGRKAKRDSNGISFHSLRHTATSLLKNAGVSEAVTRDLVGHESAAVSANYTHIDDISKRNAIAKLPDIMMLPHCSTSKKPQNK